MTDYTETLKGLKDISDTFFAIGTSPINANNISIQIAYDKGWVKTIDDASAAIEELTAQLPKRGEWIYNEYTDGNWYCTCSNCGKGDLHAIKGTVPYCWNCGAKMEVQE